MPRQQNVSYIESVYQALIQRRKSEQYTSQLSPQSSSVGPTPNQPPPPYPSPSSSPVSNPTPLFFSSVHLVVSLVSESASERAESIRRLRAMEHPALPMLILHPMPGQWQQYHARDAAQPTLPPLSATEVGRPRYADQYYPYNRWRSKFNVDASKLFAFVGSGGGPVEFLANGSVVFANVSADYYLHLEDDVAPASPRWEEQLLAALSRLPPVVAVTDHPVSPRRASQSAVAPWCFLHAHRMGGAFKFVGAGRGGPNGHDRDWLAGQGVGCVQAWPGLSGSFAMLFRADRLLLSLAMYATSRADVAPFDWNIGTWCEQIGRPVCVEGEVVQEAGKGGKAKLSESLFVHLGKTSTSDYKAKKG